MKSFQRLVCFVISLLVLDRLNAEEITVFAAASLTNVMTEIGATHEKVTGDKVVFNFAAANSLVRQIEAGAPADVFFSADEAQMDVLANKGLIDKATRKSMLGNTLVIITAPGGPAITKVSDLEKLGLWEKLQPKLVPAENVRAALAVVESGNAEAGIVYQTDAAISKNVKIALEIPAAEGPSISYPVARVADSRHAAAAAKFLARLASPESGVVFTKQGFILLNTNP